MRLEDFDYMLPEELIAQKPMSPRDHSRLMVIDKKIEHKRFYDIADYLSEGDVLVINETKVNPAKVLGRKLTGGEAYIIVNQVNGRRCFCRVKAAKPRIGARFVFGKYKAEIVDEVGAGEFIMEFDVDAAEVMEVMGQMPIPPYIKRKLDREDQYQTVYSRKKGSVAAPTAGLHFTRRLLDKIKKKGIKIAKVTLHVDFGTFLPVRDIKSHKMHEEYFVIDKKNADIIDNRKGKLFLVGTTSVRALESAADPKGDILAKRGKTGIFIKPGYKFRTKIDGLITNFHFPKSTLLMLVSAFIGRKRILEAYKIAVKEKYRFFSFGDSMLILKG